MLSILFAFFKLAQEMFFVLANPFFSLPRAFRVRREIGGSFRGAWWEAMNQRWRERQVQEDFSNSRFAPEMGTPMAYWKMWADTFKVRLNLDEIERIIREHSGSDESDFPGYVIPLSRYAERQWKKQRPWHYRWGQVRRKFYLWRLRFRKEDGE